MGNYTIFLKFENLRRGRQARNFSENDPKILDLKSSSEQIIFRKLSLGAPENLKIYENNILEGWEYWAEKQVIYIRQSEGSFNVLSIKYIYGRRFKSVTFKCSVRGYEQALQ